MNILFYYIFFFFFQAEDGIRDKLVTGVQTCALPIYRVHAPRLEAVEVVGRSLEELDAWLTWRSVEMLPDGSQGCRGEIGAVVMRALGSQTEQEQPAATADLENPSRPEAANPIDGRIEPLAHLVRRNRLSRVAAVPSSDVERRVGGEDRVGVGLLEHALPSGQPVIREGVDLVMPGLEVGD